MTSINLRKSEEIISKIKDNSLEDYKNVSCWIDEGGNYNIHIFLAEFSSENLLLNKWRTLTGEIANDVQDKLIKKIEIWNIYIIFIVNSKVKKSNKYLIEQNKYSSRKIVVDSFQLENDEQRKKLIIEKLLTLNIDRDIKTEKTKRIVKFKELINEKNTKLFNLIELSDRDPKDIFRTYLEELINERKN